MYSVVAVAKIHSYLTTFSPLTKPYKKGIISMFSQTKFFFTLTLLFAILLSSGCATKTRSYEPRSDKPRTNKTTTHHTQSVKKQDHSIPTETKTVTLFNQELSYSALQTAKVKLYPYHSKHLKGKLYYSWYSIPKIRRSQDYHTFCFSKTSSKRFSTPYYKVMFSEPTKIDQIYIFHTEKAYDDRGKKISIEPALYKVKQDPNTHSFLPYTANNYDDITTIKKFVEKGIKVDGINWWTNKKEYVKEIYISIDDLQNMNLTKYVNITKTPTIKVAGYSVKSVVFDTLKQRKSLQENESLVKTIFQTDSKLFRAIQKNRNSFKLPKKSYAKLPLDIDISYARKYYAKIIKTGRYMDKNGRYKHTKRANSFFDTSGTYKSTLSVKVKGEKVKTVIKSGSAHKSSSFIDFSKGI
jgi:hypothetical protein